MNRRLLAITVLVLVTVALGASVIALTPSGSLPSSTPRFPSAEPSSTPLGAFIQVRPIASAVIAPHDSTMHPPPLAESPQRRLWWAGGRWWAILPDPDSEGWELFASGDPDGPWSAQGTMDDRRRVRFDVAVRGDDLLVAAAGTGGERDALRATRYVLDGDRYRMVPDGPIEVRPAGVRSLSAAFDADGDPWLAFIADGRLTVLHGLDGGARWEPDPSLTGEAVQRTPTLVSLVNTSAGLALAWTAEGADQLWIERSSPSGWTETGVDLVGPAGGTLGTVAVPGQGGELLALVSLGGPADGQSPGLVIVRDRAAAPPTVSLVARVADRFRAAAMSLVPDAAAVVVFSTVSAPGGGSLIAAKAAPLETLAFETGSGSVALAGQGGSSMRDVLAPAVASAGGELAIVAADTGISALWAGLVGVGDGVPPARPSPLPAASSVPLARLAFDGQPVGSPPPGWTRPGARVGSLLVAEGARAGRFVRLTGARADAARACFRFRAVASGELVVAASVRLGRLGGGDAWLSLRGMADAAGIRFDDDRRIAYRSGTTKVWTRATFASNRWYRWTTRIDVAQGLYGWTLTALDGTPVAAVDGVASGATAGDAIDQLCFEVPAGRAPTMDLDGVEIDHVLNVP